MRSVLLAVTLLLGLAGPASAWTDDAQACVDRRGDAQDLLAACQRALDGGTLSTDDRAKTFHNRGIILFELARYADAADDFTNAIELQPDMAPAYAKRGNAHRELGQARAALHDYQQAIRLDPDGEAHAYLAWLYDEQGRYEEAIEAYDEAIRVQPEDPFLHNDRGVSQLNATDFAAAVEDFSAAIRLKPDYVIAYRNRAIAHDNLGQRAQAVRDYNFVLKRDPEDMRARFGLLHALDLPSDAPPAAIEQKLAMVMPPTQRTADESGPAAPRAGPVVRATPAADDSFDELLAGLAAAGEEDAAPAASPSAGSLPVGAAAAEPPSPEAAWAVSPSAAEPAAGSPPDGAAAAQPARNALEAPGSAAGEQAPPLEAPAPAPGGEDLAAADQEPAAGEQQLAALPTEEAPAATLGVPDAALGSADAVAAAAAATGERRVALVIGNGSYRAAPALPNPPNDARDVAGKLRKLGFEVTVAIDHDRQAMLRAITDFGRQLDEGGVGLFYYAGHAVQVEGSNYMIPVNAEIDHQEYVPVEAVDVNQVLARMDGAKNRLNIVVLDACRDNPFAGAFRNVSRGLAQAFAPTGTFVAYATAPGQVAADGFGRNSPYTGALLEVLEMPGLKLEELFKQVRVSVRDATDGQQTPWENSSITGDFYFVPPAEMTARSAESEDFLVWQMIKNSKDQVDFQMFMEAFPDSSLLPLAASRVKALGS